MYDCPLARDSNGRVLEARLNLESLPESFNIPPSDRQLAKFNVDWMLIVAAPMA